MSINTLSSPDRIGWIDQAKGIGIICVVLGHMIRGAMTSGLIDGAFWTGVDYAIYLWHMPLFFVISGMTLRPPRSDPKFIQRKAKTLLWPYFVWSILFGLCLVALSGVRNGSMDLARLFEIPYNPIPPFWFLYVLFLLNVAVWVTGLHRWLVPASFALLLLSPFIPNRTVFEFSYFAFFFMSGAVLRRFRVEVWVAAVALVVFCVGVATASQVGYDSLYYYSPLMIPTTIAGVAIVIWVAQRTDIGAFAFLGRRSLEIYILHIFFTAGSRIAMSRLPFDLAPTVQIGIGTVLGLLGPLMVWTVLRHLKLAGPLGLSRNAIR